MKHIPGPYVVEDIFGHGCVDICLGYDVPGEGSPIFIGSVIVDDERDGPMTLSKAIATAHLWAASHDLLEACKALLDLATLVGHLDEKHGQWNTSGQCLIHPDQKSDCAKAVLAARDAIAKAEAVE